MTTELCPAELDAAYFMAEHGHLPMLGEGPDPWLYRGWLLPYVQMAEIQINKENSRWAYMIQILNSGVIPDGPIPQIRFGRSSGIRADDTAITGPHRQATQAIQDWSRIIGYDMGGWDDFRTLMDWFLWGLALSKNKPVFHRPEAAEKLYRTVDVSVLLHTPWDYFGAYISEHKSNSWNPTAFYPTPHEVVECMVQMMGFDEGGGCKLKTVCDPCLGSGRMLLHASNYSLRLYGCDIDRVVLNAALINGALYAPWLAYPLPDHLFLERAAEQPRACGDEPAPIERGIYRTEPDEPVLAQPGPVLRGKAVQGLFF